MKTPPWRAAAAVLAVAALFHFTAPARSQALFLPEDLQIRVNQAIEAGAQFLQATQLPTGTWGKSHEAGLAALPALTLLECGVPPLDPLVQKAAQFIRWKAAKLEGTYELALSVLFLDRLGDPQDNFLIQVLAMRLVAGQTATGGWGYSCPILPTQTHKELLALLKKLGPPPLFDPLGRDAPLMAKLPFQPVLKNPALNNPLAGKDGPFANLNPLKKPGEIPQPLDPLAKPGSPPDSQSPGSSGTNPGLIAPGIDGPLAKGVKGQPGAEPGFPSRKGWCIKLLEGPTRNLPVEAEKDPAAAAAAKVKIPPHLNNVAVLYDPAILPVVEVESKRTDNSNSQFAMLALWVGRRHGIPMTRTLNLIAKRYQTSQNENGSWGYRYKFGGGEGGSPAMICVGLLGMAISHGLAVEHGAKPGAAPPKKAAPDPRIILGFLALDPHIGDPTGKVRDLPMANLYYLWSVERLAVLFDLSTIGKKDWYCWGSEILVANQKREGFWDHKGGYPGAQPVLDTCLALLFLKRANLARDLAAKLPFNPRDLSEAIIAHLPAPLEATPLEQPRAAVKPGSGQAGIKLANPLLAQASTKDNNRLAPMPASAPVPRVEEAKTSAWPLILGILGFLSLLLVVAGVLLFVLRNRPEEEDDDEQPSGKGKRRKSKSPARSSS